MADFASNAHSNFSFNMDCRIFFASALICTMMVQCSCSVPYRHDKSRYCGNRLVKEMTIICQGRYNSPKDLKRSDIFNQKFLDDLSSSDSSDDYNQNALAPSSSFFDRLFDTENPFIPERQQRGIFDECCRKPCTREALMNYCA